jgi:hypothetical protein
MGFVDAAVLAIVERGSTSQNSPHWISGTSGYYVLVALTR